MKMSILTQEQKEVLLTDRELREYQIYMRLGRPPMAASISEKFFTLFQNGQNCEEIHRLNPSGFSLGAIVRARMDDNWDERKSSHQAQIMGRAKERLQQITVETMERVALELAASNKLVTDKVLKFLQSGNEADLDGTAIGTLKHLREMTEILQKLTGQDKQQPQSLPDYRQAPVQSVATPEKPVLEALPVGEPIKPQLAANALEVIHKNRGGR